MIQWSRVTAYSAVSPLDFDYRFFHYNFPISYYQTFIGLVTHGTENINNFLGTTQNGAFCTQSYIEIGMAIPTATPSPGNWDGFLMSIGY